MPDSDYLFVQPLLGPDDNWAAYHVETLSLSPASLACLNDSPLMGEFDQRHPWFMPVTEETRSLMAQGHSAIPVFPANVGDSEDLRATEAALRQGKCKLALEAAPVHKLPATGTWDYLLISASHARSLPPYTLLGLASRTTVIATGVNSRSDRDWALNNACALTTGEFLMMRSGQHDKADITRLKLLEILALIQEDADTDALKEIFRQEPKLSYSLLRLVNSAALAPRNPIQSFNQAIDLLGRRKLQRWLQLLIYSNPDNGQQANPLLLKAATRGRLMELLADHLSLSSSEGDDTAFMIGTFSLLDALLDMPMSEILQQLPLPEPTHQALSSHSGLLGELLGAIDMAEKRDLPHAVQRLKQLGLSASPHLEAQLMALAWATKIRQAV